MTDKKLIIPQKKFKGDSSVVSVRLPADLLKNIDDIATGTGRTRNEIVQMCLEFAVENIVVNG